MSFGKGFRRGSCVLRILIVGLIGALPARAQTGAGDLADQAVAWLQQYIQINTINPPGNEIAGARFLAGILETEGIPYEIVELAPGRGNIWARLAGGDAPSLVLLHHIDVVPADPNYWRTDPLSGEIRDGVLHGRGAIDTKGLGIVHLAAFLGLHRSGVALDRDVIFMAGGSSRTVPSCFATSGMCSTRAGVAPSWTAVHRPHRTKLRLQSEVADQIQYTASVTRLCRRNSCR